MRNLRILNKGQVKPISRSYPDLKVLTSLFDAISDSITIVLHSIESSLIEVQQFMKNGEIKLLASFNIKENDKLLSFAHFADTLQLIFVFEQGDLLTATYNYDSPDFDTTIVEIVGTIDCGLSCASWSPDEETLSLVTNEKNVLLLSRLFEPISEKYMNPMEINSNNNQVSVGWGKKETQFQGKGAKQLEREREILKHAGLNIDSENAILHDPTVSKFQNGNLSDYDYKTSKISWRGDCQFFSINNIEESKPDQFRRVIRVYSRDGELISCSEPIDGQEENLSWKPQGSLIASTQRRFEEEIGEEVLDLIFFEKNGLRHGDFTTRLPPGSKIIDLDWSCDSQLIAFQLYDSIQIWVSKNYHWYLKQEIFSIHNEPIIFMKFHPEKPLRIMIGTESTLEIVDMTYCINSGPTAIPYDQGMTLVTDGNTCLITPFSLANVPPPMSLREIMVDDPIVDMSVSQSSSIFAILTNNHLNIVQVDLKRLITNVKHPELVSTIDKSIFANDNNNEQLRQCCIINNDTVAVLFDSDNFSRIALIDITDLQTPQLLHIQDVLLPKVVLLKSSSDMSQLTYETVDGSIYLLNTITFETTLITKFPQLCNDYNVIQLPINDNEWETNDDNTSKLACFGMSQNGKLFINDKTLCSGITSLLLTESHLLYTTAQHQLKFVHLINNKSLFGSASEENILDSSADDHDERTRMIERGSLLVTAMPSKASVILQAPRGNLETICPRIMVLTGVRDDIKNKRYKDAFLTCRTHRISLDILHDYNPELFYKNIELFIKQIDKVEYIDLFLSCLLEEDVTETKYKETLSQVDDLNMKSQELYQQHQVYQNLQNLSIVDTDELFKKPIGKEKISKICEAILSVLLQPENKSKYIQTITTAYACQHPPKIEDALNLIGTFNNESEIEKSVQHLCFLLDVNKLYNIALGIYNIPLALVIAQQSQKDPKEYLPFLQNLHIQTDLRKKFMIDTHLKKFEKALDSLTLIPNTETPNIDDEILEYVIDKDLYKHALGIYRYKKDKFNVILKAYADHLESTQEYIEAGIIYEQLDLYSKALENYILAKKWKESIALVLRPELKSQLKDVAERLITSLSDSHDYSSAAYIEFKFMNNIEESLKLYCKQYAYEDAIMLCIEENKPELVESIIDPALGEGFGTIAELLADCKSQITSQLNRLRELRDKKQQDPFAFYGEAGENGDTPDNVSIAASETSTKESFFTRYTGKTGGTAKTGASRRTAKNKRREERKRARGKKGTIYEEEYLIQSIGRLVDRLSQTQPEAIRLIEGLLRRKMTEQAHQIQKNFVEVITLLKENVVEIYNISEKDRERIDENGLVYLIPEIPVPTINDFPVKNVLDY
ncbi:hypothetical protein CANARDRAFT_194619 [[Candida] arabinofermentans NRRL YB-2248]|uniref:Elongator complex protein 1 n=1 Tax=[Candida] arabinofermentans NRRL YB-2248 TaxID=983967 RepID=A0A1E4T785_9ASCO|nr:hypothetical protein CANARDRAFT_194619 [[Candida] arabinofermentans NRRL YB-2248]